MGHSITAQPPVLSPSSISQSPSHCAFIPQRKIWRTFQKNYFESVLIFFLFLKSEIAYLKTALSRGVSVKQSYWVIVRSTPICYIICPSHVTAHTHEYSWHSSRSVVLETTYEVVAAAEWQNYEECDICYNGQVRGAQLLHLQAVIMESSKHAVRTVKMNHLKPSSKMFVLFYILFVLCRSVYCLCVTVLVTTATGWLPNCS
jgi:hypothetical protein